MSGCSRRELMQLLGALGLSACIDSGGPPTGNATACGTQLCLDLADPANASLRTVGGSLQVDGSQGRVFLLVRTSETAVIALSAVCTHEGCLVSFDSGQNLIVCPCHGSEFGEDGHVIRGPARSPLATFPASLSSNQVVLG